jgi:hypothetical protein
MYYIVLFQNGAFCVLAVLRETRVAGMKRLDNLWCCICTDLNDIEISFEFTVQQEVVYNRYYENCVTTAGDGNVQPRCDGNFVELYCDLLEGEGESGRNTVYP